MMRIVALLCLALTPSVVFCQKKADKELSGALQRNLKTLEAGDISAQQYVASRFRSLGLSPRGERDGYLQPLVLDKGRSFTPGSTLEIDSHPLAAGSAFWPLAYSGSGTAAGNPLIAVQERKQPWIMDLSNYFDTPVSGALFTDSVYQLAAQAMSDQASAVIFYDSKDNTPALSFGSSTDKPALAIPAIYLPAAAARRHLADPTASVKINLHVSITPVKDTVYTVVAGIDNNAPSTVILAARTPRDKSLLVTLAPMLKNTRAYNRANYLLAAFPSGEGDTAALTRFLAKLPEQGSGARCLLLLNGAAGGTLLIRGTGSSAGWSSIVGRIREKSPVIRTETAADPLLATLPVPALSFTGSGDEPGSVLSTLHLLGVLVENLNRRGETVLAGGKR